MGRVAFIFPGQGSQVSGMGRELAGAFPAARRVFEEADAATGASISGLCFEGSAEDLALTENTQPCVVAASVAALRCLEERGLAPDFVSGHSLGEWSALVAAGVLPVGAAVQAVRARGRYMQEAVPVGVGAMAAVIGMEREAVARLCASARHEGEVLSPANFNAPGQVVIAGHRPAVLRAVEAAVAEGARRPVLLPVSAPFHCALMQPAADRLAADLAAPSFKPPAMPVVVNVTGREVSDAEELRAGLVRQVVAPVLWEDGVRRLVELGVDTFVEVGPGRVLSGLVRRTAREAKLHAVATPADVEAVASALA